MTNFSPIRLQRGALTVAAVVGLILSSGCGSSPQTTATDTTKPRQTPSPQTTAQTNGTGPRKSVFMVDAKFRDPFFPKSTRGKSPPPSGVQSNALPSDVSVLLHEGFQGIIGTQDHRIAIIHNTILETSKSAVIIARKGGTEHKIPVRCLDVTMNSVTLLVQGQPVPVTITRGKVQKN